MPYSKSKSLIVTGSKTWYVYTATNFVQKTLCLVPTNYHLLLPEYYKEQITKMLRHINSIHLNECKVQFDKISPRIVHVDIVSGQNIKLRRIPPIFMRNEDDENKIITYPFKY